MTYSTELRYPHEYAEELAGTHQSLPSMLGQVMLCTIDMQYAGLGRLIDSNEIFERGAHGMASRIMGAEACWGGKGTFEPYVRDLGFRAAATMVVEPQDAISDEIRAKVAALDDQNPQRFCKPRLGSQGKGAYLAPDTEMALQYVATSRRSYLVQEALVPVEDWRVVLHRSVQDVKEAGPPSWFIAYEKVRPTVVGDGFATVGELVAADARMPESAKIKYRKRHRGDLSRVPDLGEKVDLIKTGNISQGAYGRLPSPQERAVLGDFALDLLTSIEADTRLTYGTVCFDIGTRQADTLTQPTTVDELRKQIVLYELSVAFGLSGYRDAVSREDSGRLRGSGREYTYRVLWARS